MTSDELIDALCNSFEMSNATWAFDNYTYSSSVMFYTAAIRLTKRKPFQDAEVQQKILEFLEKKLDEATENLLTDAMERLGVVFEKADISEG